MYRVRTVCDIVLNGEVVESDFYDEEYFDTKVEAEEYISKYNIGDTIAYHGEAEDVLTDIILDEISPC